MLANNFQYCVIRAYAATDDDYPEVSLVYNGLHYINSFDRFVTNRCYNLINPSNAGTGSFRCVPVPDYETFAYMDICICATDNCNQNLSTCRTSASNTMNLSADNSLTPDLTAIIPCNDTVNTFITCTDHPYIDASACEKYIHNNSVLCAITRNGTLITQAALIIDYYDIYLTDQIYQLNSLPNTAIVSLNETNNTVYYKYDLGTTISLEECACATVSFCNQDINTCASNPASTTQITVTTTAITNTNATMATGVSTATNATMVTGVSTATNATMATGVSTATNATMASNASMTTITTTNTGMTIATNITTNATTASMTTVMSSTTANANAQNLESRETGLGSAATAGLVCGIIFSVLLFIGEIVFFKFCYHGGSGGGPERSATYRA